MDIMWESEKDKTGLIKFNNTVLYFIGEPPLGSLTACCWHRVGGPCLIKDDYISFYVYDKEYYLTREYCAACRFDENTTLYWFIRYGEILPKRLEDFEK